MTKLILCIVISIFGTDLVHSAGVKFNIKLSQSIIDIECSFTLGKGEKMTSVSLSKDGKIFFKYNSGQESSPTLSNITGIDLMKTSTGCKVQILNYQNPGSMGIYEARVQYKDKGGKTAMTNKLYKLSMKYSKCQATWEDATQDSDISCFIAAARPDGTTLRPCKSSAGDRAGYFEKGKGCVITFGGVPDPLTEFQVLTGTGFQWLKHEGGAETVPAGSYKIGSDFTGDMYFGRCNYEGSSYVGKITNAFFFNLDNNEVTNCPTHEILACS